MNNLSNYLKELEIKPNDEKLYITAFTHQTFSNEKKLKINYQKLEFLGDSVLGKVIAEYIFINFPEMDEGQMTMLKSNVVQGLALAKFAKQEGLDRFLRIGQTKEDLKNNDKILEDVFEAFVAAIYLDQGIEAVKKFLKRNVIKQIGKVANKNLKNPKTILQELLQAESRAIIRYECKEIPEGFEARVFFDNSIMGMGRASTKKEAEVNAAKDALRKAEI